MSNSTGASLPALYSRQVSQHFSGPCFSVDAMRELDKRSATAQGLTEFELMRLAGHAAFVHLRSLWPNAERIAVLCGTGNNGGDGWIVARHLVECGVSCDVFLLGQRDRISGPARLAYDEWRTVSPDAERSSQDWFDFAEREVCYDVLVDALVGIGMKGRARPEFNALVESINGVTTPVLSLDVPSGLDGNTGASQSSVVEAHTTITFIAMKPGLLTGRARDVVGNITLEPLGTPSRVFDEVAPASLCWANELPSPLLRPRRATAHKGTLGHVLIVGGNVGMGGAAILAAAAALRAGAGLVSLATRSVNLLAAITRHPEVMTHDIDQPEDLSACLERASIVVIGPGLGVNEWSKACLKLVLESKKPLVVDADALNLLAEDASTARIAEGCVLTPHPGEAARLAKVQVSDIESDRLSWAQSLARRYQSTIILKGAGSIVATHEDARVPNICSTGNPGMATGGMGDVLAGVVGALLGQGHEAGIAALGGALVHAAAGDRAWRDQGIGLTATDVIGYLGSVLTPELVDTQ